MKPVVLHPEARKELEAAIEYYERQSQGLGSDLLSEAEKATERIRQNSKRWPRYKETAFRTCLVQRFPYVVFFQEQQDRIWVVAIAHARRRPDYWQTRAQA